VGEHDLVAAGLGESPELDFWKIAMRPGKPLMAGRFGDLHMIGLPRNPVSSMVCAILFIVPALHRLSGLPAAPPAMEEAVLGAAVPANDHRADHLRATLTTGEDGAPVATAFTRQDSAMLRALAQADALILRPPHAPALPAGARADHQARQARHLSPQFHDRGLGQNGSQPEKLIHWAAIVDGAPP
jgi:molybdopterin molybdotransferase